MGVPEQEHAALRQGRKIIRVVVMSMGQIEGFPVQKQLGKLRHAGKRQNHLVNLRLTVAPNRDDVFPVPAQHGDHLLRRVVPGQVVPGAVVQQISQQNQPVRAFRLDQVAKAAAPEGAAVNVGRNQQFHKKSSIFQMLHKGR